MTQVYWLKGVDGAFDRGADWSGGVVPNAKDSAVLGAFGDSPYVVTSGTDQTIRSIETGSGATLGITAGVFTVNAGTGGGDNAGRISVTGRAALNISGRINNTGVIALGKNGGSAAMIVGIPDIGVSATLVGGGTVTLGPKGAIYASNKFPFGGIKLINVDNTISGEGMIGADRLTLINGTAGVIDALGPGPMTLEGTIVNRGLIEATGGGALRIEGTIDNSSGGVLVPGANLILRFGSVVGGSLTLETGTMVTVTGINNELAPETLVNNGRIRVAANARLELQGDIDNTGAIELGSGRRTDLLIGTGGVTLSGGGILTLGAGAGSSIIAAAAGASLTNVDNTLSGAGLIGGGMVALSNRSAGVIEGNGLVIDIGANTIINAGLIEGAGPGGATIAGAVKNIGILEANGASLILGGAVTGAGRSIVDGGLLEFKAAFDGDVIFTNSGGTLELAHSQNFAGTVAGFSVASSLDLDDIGFKKSGEASFAGNKTGGILTVTDGTHTATIRLRGDYRHVVFTVAKDGAGGVLVGESSGAAGASLAAPVTGQAHPFIAAMAGLGALPAGATAFDVRDRPSLPCLLAGPKTATA